MLSILGMIFVLIATFLVFKTARDSGRNPFGWALATLSVGFGFQIILPMIIGVVIGIVMATSGQPISEIEEAIQTPAIIIAIAGLVLSVIGIGLIMRYVAKIPEEKSFVAPPRPPDFN